jgi:DNA-binding transcriptional LysR family regulator
MDKLHCMEIFARVVEAESYTEAAEKLGMSRSAVSKRVMQLEADLNVRLLNRTTRRVMPTEAGLAYYERCMRIFLEASEADRLVKRLHADPQGTLMINAPVSFGIHHLGSAIAEFAAHHPDLNLSVSLSDRFTNLAEEGCDVAIRVAKQVDPGLIAERIAPVRVVLAAAPSYLERIGAPSAPKDLVNHSCLHYTYLASRDIWNFIGPDGAHTIRVASRITANNGEVLLQAALSGLGIAHLPTFLVHRELASGQLQIAMPEYKIPEISLFAVHRPSRQSSGMVRLLVEHLRECFGPEPYWDQTPNLY